MGVVKAESHGGGGAEKKPPLGLAYWHVKRARVSSSRPPMQLTRVGLHRRSLRLACGVRAVSAAIICYELQRAVGTVLLSLARGPVLMCVRVGVTQRR